MKVLGIRYCAVTKDAEALARFLGQGLGLPEMDLGMGAGKFSGAVFPAGESWVEIWPEGPQMPATTMLQIVVDDADAWAIPANAPNWAPLLSIRTDDSRSARFRRERLLMNRV